MRPSTISISVFLDIRILLQAFWHAWSSALSQQYKPTFSEYKWQFYIMHYSEENTAVPWKALLLYIRSCGKGFTKYSLHYPAVEQTGEELRWTKCLSPTLSPGTAPLTLSSQKYKVILHTRSPHIKGILRSQKRYYCIDRSKWTYFLLVMKI